MPASQSHCMDIENQRFGMHFNMTTFIFDTNYNSIDNSVRSWSILIYWKVERQIRVNMSLAPEIIEIVTIVSMLICSLVLFKLI